MKILVVDDEHIALFKFLAETSEDPTREYKLLSTPESALEYIKTNKPDAAFLDINMPRIDGVELAERLIAVNPDIEIVFISGYAHNEKELYKKLGKNLKGFCYKPYSTDTLISFLNRLSERVPVKVKIRTFGLFDISIYNRPLNFTRAKSKELLAVLIDKEGVPVSIEKSIDLLWPDKNTENAKKLYQDAKTRLKIALKQQGLDDLIYIYRGELAVNRERVDCDLWTALDTGNLSAYHGEYMTQYAEWSIERQSILDVMKK